MSGDLNIVVIHYRSTSYYALVSDRPAVLLVDCGLSPFHRPGGRDHCAEVLDRGEGRHLAA